MANYAYINIVIVITLSHKVWVAFFIENGINPRMAVYHIDTHTHSEI